MVMLLKPPVKPMTCAHGTFFSQNYSNIFVGTTTKVLLFVVLWFNTHQLYICFIKNRMLSYIIIIIKDVTPEDKVSLRSILNN